MRTELTGVLVVVSSLVAAGPAMAESAMERGEYRVKSIVACGNCHTEQTPQGPNGDKRLAGTFVIETPEFKAYAPNITPEKESSSAGRGTRRSAPRDAIECIKVTPTVH